MADLIKLTSTPECDVMFQPSLKQQLFRGLAAAMVTDGRFFHSDWLVASRNEAAHMDPVTAREWKQWTADENFVEWFYDVLPDLSTVDDMDMKWLEQRYWAAIRDGLLRGESWACREFAARRWAKDAKDGQVNINIAGEISDFLTSGQASMWKTTKSQTGDM